MISKKTKKDLIQKLLDETSLSPKKITVDEYRQIYELSKFKCPFHRYYPDCNMSDCPTKLGETWETYEEECHLMRHAKNLIDMIFSGEIIVDYNSEGWEIRV